MRKEKRNEIVATKSTSIMIKQLLGSIWESWLNILLYYYRTTSRHIALSPVHLSFELPAQENTRVIPFILFISCTRKWPTSSEKTDRQEHTKVKSEKSHWHWKQYRNISHIICHWVYSCFGQFCLSLPVPV